MAWKQSFAKFARSGKLIVQLPHMTGSNQSKNQYDSQIDKIKDPNILTHPHCIPYLPNDERLYLDKLGVFFPL